MLERQTEHQRIGFRCAPPVIGPPLARPAVGPGPDVAGLRRVRSLCLRPFLAVPSDSTCPLQPVQPLVPRRSQRPAPAPGSTRAGAAPKPHCCCSPNTGPRTGSAAPAARRDASSSSASAAGREVGQRGHGGEEEYGGEKVVGNQQQPDAAEQQRRWEEDGRCPGCLALVPAGSVRDAFGRVFLVVGFRVHAGSMPMGPARESGARCRGSESLNESVNDDGLVAGMLVFWIRGAWERGPLWRWVGARWPGSRCRCARG